MNDPPSARQPRHFVLLAGLSGSGKSVALNMLEDLDYYTIDNMPIAAIDNVVQVTLGKDEDRYEQLAIGVDPRSSSEEFERLIERVDAWRSASHGCTVIYLRTDEDILVKRYRESRRPHPFSEGAHDLSAAIGAERQALEPLAQLADIHFDTSRTSVHDLRDLIRKHVTPETDYPMTLVVESFSYRGGIPNNADLVFDVRCLPNPYWDASLRSLSGHDPEVVAFMQEHPVVNRMSADLLNFVSAWLSAYRSSNRGYLTIAIGCTGGRHRSVYISERLARELEYDRRHMLVKHRDLGPQPSEDQVASDLWRL
ncbi:MAG: RNase adapter RapZ [Gammaproteobacteria bacterium]|nr:RNase adapter RapZ [Gammaproteobacteria bacterium]